MADKKIRSVAKTFSWRFFIFVYWVIFGYINLMGFLVFVPVTTVMARIGAKAVHKIDKKLLSKIFGIFLICVSIRSFFEYLNIS